MNDIGNRLKTSIKELRLTNKVFAEKLGIAPNYISMIISGNKKFSDSLKMSISKSFPELNLNYIETGEGPILNSINSQASEPIAVYKTLSLSDFTPSQIIKHILDNKEEFEKNTTFQLFVENIKSKGDLEQAILIKEKLEKQFNDVVNKIEEQYKQAVNELKK